MLYSGGGQGGGVGGNLGGKGMGSLQEAGEARVRSGIPKVAGAGRNTVVKNVAIEKAQKRQEP